MAASLDARRRPATCRRDIEGSYSYRSTKLTRDAVVIVGANLAGARAAESLRTHGFEGSIALIGAEPWLPYERPPLSKEQLYEPGREPSRLLLHNERFYADHHIDLMLGTRVTRLDPSRDAVEIQGGRRLRANQVILCTGGRARRLAVDGADLDGVFCLRTLSDALALAPRMVLGARVVVVGMGVIGGEVASSALRRGCVVVGIEPAPLPFLRVLGEHYGRWLAEQHRASGVRLLVETSVMRIVGERGSVRGVETSDGKRIPADVVVVGIGMDPAVELAVDAGLAVHNGVLVDRECRTSCPDVWCVGDASSAPDFIDPTRRVRVETFQNAQLQGDAAAASLVGKAIPDPRPTWFWTDQLGLNIQVCGAIVEPAIQILRGDEHAASFCVFFVRGGIVQGVLTVNRPGDMAIGRRIVERRFPAVAALGDESVPLRTLLATPR